MPWINGRWRPEGWQTGGFDRGPVGGGFPGLLGDVRRGPGVPNPPQINPPGYGQGPQMQPTPYKPVQWAGPNAIYPNWGDDPSSGYANDVALTYLGDPYQPHTPWQSGLAPRQPWTPPPQRPIQGPPIPPSMVAPPIQGQPIPPQFPSLPPQMDPPRPPTLPPDLIFDPPPDWRPRTDHEFNVAQREKTKRNLATDRAKTKKHYAKLRAQGASPQTIAKAKAKSKARSKKIKGQSLRRRTIKN